MLEQNYPELSATGPSRDPTEGGRTHPHTTHLTIASDRARHSPHRQLDAAHGGPSRNAPAPTSSTVAPTRRLYNQNATIVMIGMKGVGKTSLGVIATCSLGRTFIDVDHYISTSEAASLESYVTKHGWPAFRAREAETLKMLLSRHPYNAIIACGGGIIESSESRRILKSAKATFPVICIMRENDRLQEYILTQARLQYPEDLIQLIKRREPLFIECASHFFYNLTCEDESGQAAGSDGSPSHAGVHPLKFKQIGDSFLRLICSIVGDAPCMARQGILPTRSQMSSPAPTPQIRSPREMSPQTGRSSITHLLASHGPGPDVSEGRRNTDIRCSQTHNDSSTNSREQSVGRASPFAPANLSIMRHAVLPHRANVLSRNSLFTRRTTAMSLTFPDLTLVDPALMKEITQGVDALELRADLLACLAPLTRAARESRPLEPPKFSINELVRQMETLRKLAPDMPILFTVRSTREGGYFYDDRRLTAHETASAHSQAIYFRLLEVAVGAGVELVDIELGWDPVMTRHAIEGRGRSKVVASYHDLTGALKWDTTTPMQLYERARSFGSGVHIVQMIGTATRTNVAQNVHLASCLAKMLASAASDPVFRMPPLMAINMSRSGRASRPFNDVLNFVSHPAMATKAGAGQLSLRALMETLVRLSMILKTRFHIVPVHGTANVAKRAIRSAFDEFGLPFTLSEWSQFLGDVVSYLEHNQREDVTERTDDGMMPEAASDGLFLPTAKAQQKELYDVMRARMPHRLTWPARIVEAVDVLAREDCAPMLLGSERARHSPSALGDLQGPLVGCHTLPPAIFRVMRAHLAPINAPGANRSALVVVLRDSSGNTEAKHATTIAKRAAVFAMGKLGFGSTYVYEESESSASEEGTASAKLFMGWTEDVVDLIEQSGSDILEAHNDRAEVAPKVPDTPPGTNVVRLRSTEDLRHLGTRSSLSHVRFPEREQAWSATPLPRDEEKTNEDDQLQQQKHQERLAAGHEQLVALDKDMTHRPCAVVIVGGTEASQTKCIRTLQDPIDTASAPGTGDPPLTAPASEASSGLTLPREVWETLFGGTIVRLPSQRSVSFGVQEDGWPTQEPLHTGDAHTSTLERGGWIHVAPHVIERDAVQRTVVEAWTRRSAPAQRMRFVWEDTQSLQQQ